MKINKRQKLYVIPSNGGYTCLGFEVVERRTRALRQFLRNEPSGLGLDLGRDWIGTQAHWNQYQKAMRAAEEFCTATGTRCPVELTPALIGLEGKRVRVTTPEGDSRYFTVGKSTGWLPVHLEIKTRRSLGGMAAYVGPRDIVEEVKY